VENLISPLTQKLYVLPSKIVGNPAAENATKVTCDMARSAAAKLPQPSVKIPEITKGSAKALFDLGGVSRSNQLLMVTPDLIRPIKGFNPRIHDARDPQTGKTYAQELDELKESIRSEGFFLDKPISGYPGKDETGDVVYIIDGHRRMEAVNALIDEGVQIDSIPVVLTDSRTDPIKLLIQNVKKNLNRKFTFFETSIQVLRLTNFGKSKAEIAELMGLTEVAVQDCLDLIEAPKTIRNYVKAGRVSGTEALRVLRTKKDPIKAVEKIEEMIAKAESEGRTKASRKDDREAAPVKGVSTRSRGRAKSAGSDSYTPPADEEGDDNEQRLDKAVATRFPQPKPAPDRTVMRVFFTATEGDEFPVSDIRNFKNLFGDLEWFRLDDDRPQIGVALVDVEFVAYLVVPTEAVAMSGTTGPEDEEEDEEDEGDEDEDQEDEDEQTGEGEKERAAASADL
jgi:ParB family chromosome partitioning protein